ncbi:MAG: DUF1285 domain-containing protein [Deltaproteobacteria bacterium]|nr:DUF1285 domain-containing protein [Deltaproteobacteria bacterium]MBW1928225.1 DUF1285 domain-containing protein [Deltaproteobacteria bacterium]MBW2026794.1 DUF1285 domain-containing protein [Deltaproteobacteria bacterium]MBW2125885.1 DUF1285 domain-containing protein [Deltaproteobacteria bacterium]RLB15039.1 MAG: hypothetical protein DRG63_07540 [Deltaproteobacteria bacterium]
MDKGPEPKIDDLPPCLIHIDKEGKWYHQGAEIIHPGFVQFFFEHMELDDKGRYVINWNGQRCYIEVEDTAYVVRQVDFSGGNGKEERAILHLSDGSTEALAPETLFIGKEDVLYCQVKNGTFPARFLRPAYYQLAEKIMEEGGSFYLLLQGKKYPIKPSRDKSGPVS